MTGEFLLKIPLSAYLVCKGVCFQTSAFDHNWIAAYCRQENPKRYPANDILIFDVQKSLVKFLEKIPSQPPYYDPLIVRDGKVYTILDDESIPIWNAESGRLLSLTDGRGEQEWIPRILVTNFNLVAFDDDRICVYVESEEGLTKIGQKSINLDELIPDSSLTQIEDVQIIQDVAVVCFLAQIDRPDTTPLPTIYLAFFPLNGSLGNILVGEKASKK